VADRTRLSRALEELLHTEELNADRPEGWLRIALIESARGNPEAAVRSLQQSLKLDPGFSPAMVNLADLRRTQGDEAEAQRLLRRAVSIDDRDAEAWHALGLSLVRDKRLEEATAMLERAAELRPDNARFQYVYAVALGDGGDPRAAVISLLAALENHPRDRQLLSALMNYARQSGNQELVQAAATRIATLESP
jgi:tetratricopeptide (TPR) repeat protein